MGKTCTELFAGIDCTILGNADDEVNGIAYRSDRVQPGDAFFCVVGMTTDGHSFAQDAIDRGAKVLVVERKVYLADATDVTEIVVKDTRKAMAAAAANFYDHPSKDLALVGITGTNGKTTTTYLVEHIARVAGEAHGRHRNRGHPHRRRGREIGSYPRRNRPTCSSCSPACAMRAATSWPWR